MDDTAKPEKSGIDLLDRFALVVVGAGGFVWGAVYLIGERPVRIAGEIAAWIVLVLAVAAVPVGAAWFVFRAISRWRWESRERALRLQHDSYRLEAHSSGLLVGDVRKGAWHHFGAFRGGAGGSARGGKAVAESVPVASEDPQGDALRLAMRCERGMIFGGTDAGKTFFAKRLAAEKLNEGHIVIVLDPKHYKRREPWPEGVRLAGTGDRLEEIEWAFEWMDREKDRRGEDFDNVDMQPFVTVIIDELNELLVDLPGIGESYVRVLRKYREYRFGVWIMGQSDRAREIGLEKRADLKQCFNARFDIRYNPTTGERWIEVDTMSPEPVVTCPAIQPCRIVRGAKPGIEWAFRHDHEGVGGTYTPNYTRPYTHGKYTSDTPERPPGRVSDGGRRVGSGSCGQASKRPPTPLRIIHAPDNEHYVYQGKPIVETSNGRLAAVIRAAREEKSLRAVCKAGFGSPGGAQSDMVREILREYDIDSYQRFRKKRPP